jgi:hypothetical protein
VPICARALLTIAFFSVLLLFMIGLRHRNRP